MGSIRDREEGRNVVAAIISGADDLSTPPSVAAKEPRVAWGALEEKKTPNKPIHVRKQFVLTMDLIDALRLRAYKDPSMDLSGHVRAALKLYLAEELASQSNHKK